MHEGAKRVELQALFIKRIAVDFGNVMQDYFEDAQRMKTSHAYAQGVFWC